VTVYDVVEEDGRPWIVMQLVRAEGLDRVIAREGPLPPARVAAIGLDLLDALGAAHAAGVVHRDVKPGNVLLPPGRAVLTDFGIA
ncbi:protein kinase domain-containing protein, partial [Actinomadura bangladeshensis]